MTIAGAVRYQIKSLYSVIDNDAASLLNVDAQLCCLQYSILKVVGGRNDSMVFVTLGPGTCFGEIALLGTGHMNRRTASIKVMTGLYL